MFLRDMYFLEKISWATFTRIFLFLNGLWISYKFLMPFFLLFYVSMFEDPPEQMHDSALLYETAYQYHMNTHNRYVLEHIYTYYEMAYMKGEGCALAGMALIRMRQMEEEDRPVSLEEITVLLTSNPIEKRCPLKREAEEKLKRWTRILK